MEEPVDKTGQEEKLIDSLARAIVLIAKQIIKKDDENKLPRDNSEGKSNI